MKTFSSVIEIRACGKFPVHERKILLIGKWQLENLITIWHTISSAVLYNSQVWYTVALLLFTQFRYSFLHLNSFFSLSESIIISFYKIPITKTFNLVVI